MVREEGKGPMPIANPMTPPIAPLGLPRQSSGGNGLREVSTGMPPGTR